jgi:hypothetical protein
MISVWVFFGIITLLYFPVLVPIIVYIGKKIKAFAKNNLEKNNYTSICKETL